MLQFLMGFWCGCAAATLVFCLLYANKKRQWEEAAEGDLSSGEEGENGGSDRAEETFGPRVLLIDDSRLSRTVMKGFFAKHKLQVFEACNGAESLKLAQKYEFDLVFLDQCMPGMDADETLYRLWKDGGIAREVPVVAVGSAIRRENEAEYRARGYAACMGKPLQENRLDEIITQLLSQTQTAQKLKGFSYEKGLKNFDGDEQVYRETLVLFADLWKERREQLQQFLEEENMPEYAILIHAIKGDARTLGAVDFGELAYEQEMQAKAGDAGAVGAGFARVIETGDKTADYFTRMFS